MRRLYVNDRLLSADVRQARERLSQLGPLVRLASARARPAELEALIATNRDLERAARTARIDLVVEVDRRAGPFDSPRLLSPSSTCLASGSCDRRHRRERHRHAALARRRGARHDQRPARVSTLVPRAQSQPGSSHRRARHRLRLWSRAREPRRRTVGLGAVQSRSTRRSPPAPRAFSPTTPM